MSIAEFEKELHSLPEDWAVLIETNPEKVLDLSLDIIKLLTSKDNYGIILLSNRPYSSAVNIYNEKKIDLSKILFIDCISEQNELKSENVIYAGGITNLTEISMALTEASTAIEANKFLLIDSLNTFLNHNEPAVFAKFIHHILTKARSRKTPC